MIGLRRAGPRSCSASFLLVLVTAVWLALAVRPAAAGDGAPAGVVEGTVVHGATGAPMPGLQVSLRSGSATSAPVERTVSTDDAGHFRFEDLAGPASRSPADADAPQTVYELTVGYAGVGYHTGAFKLAEAHAPVELRVYDVTGADPGLRAGRVLLVLEAADVARQELLVHELLTLVNPSLQTYAPKPADGPMALVRFALPPGAHALTPTLGLQPDDMIQVDRGFAILSAVPPGPQEYGFAYRAPYAPGRFALSLAMPYGAAAVRVLVPDDGPAVGGPQLARVDDVTLDGKRYRAWSAEGIVAGEPLSFEVYGLPPRPLWRTVLDAVAKPWAAALALAGLLLAGAGWTLGSRPGLRAFHRRSRRVPLGPAVAPSAGAAGSAHRAAVVQIAALDAAFGAAQLDAAAYRRQRTALLARALATQAPAQSRARNGGEGRRRAEHTPATGNPARPRTQRPGAGKVIA